MGFRTSFGSAFGIVGFWIGRSDHQVSAGHFAPSAIQARRILICSVESGSPFGGMRVSGSELVTRLISSVFKTSAAAGRSRRRPPFCLSGPWHERQAAKIGRTSRLKSGPAKAGTANRRPTRDQRMIVGPWERADWRVKVLWRS